MALMAFDTAPATTSPTPLQSVAMGQVCYRKHFVPLESNPAVFSPLIHHHLSGYHLLHPALALTVVFPTSNAYESHEAKEEAVSQHYDGSGEDILWFKQTAFC